eukprot:Skav207171  [mRNA]  locus=scaffold573:580029:590278:- [translate_table: standard]
MSIIGFTPSFQRQLGTEESMLSLFMSIAGGVSWEEVIRPLQEMPGCRVRESTRVTRIVTTRITRIVIQHGQSAIESAQNDHAMVSQALMDNKAAHIAKLRGLFHQMNGEEPRIGSLSPASTPTAPEVREYFEALGLDIWDAWHLGNEHSMLSFFKLLDHGGDGSVDLEDFFDGCLRFRGPARAMDVGRIMQDQRRGAKRGTVTETAKPIPRETRLAAS